MFTGLFDLKKPGEYPYLAMDVFGRGEVLRGKPPAERIRDEVAFEDLPEGVRGRVLEEYRRMWGLEGD
ncbi:hypothetical protein GBA63_13550 [Rubrobacter tropicus]|uniref:Uncharacterized protein n=1 Tax=Rubrobacter tropicus TaxID=2653851 RepID=A0A6G8QAP6_9ACTN|nr:hypothetical protein GBA63_13550 [Rubrobacter tropicus]